MLTLYDFMGSGNGYKVRLLLAQLGLPYKLVECDILKGETRSPEFLQKNLNGRIPTLQLEDGSHLAESGAILWYLAEGTAFAPADRKTRAETLQWMFFEQYSHEPYIAVVRFWRHFFDELTPLQELDLPERVAKGYAALEVMERHLETRPFFVGKRYGLADIALFAYTHCAGEGGFDLKQFPHVSRWLEQVRLQPRHIPMSYRW
jgi:glutathione S-transferase